jgi:mRNA-degrading endonuclease RelE of RelBE toxin-antitoxin system
VRIRRTESFLKDYGRLPAGVKSQVDKQLAYLIQNPGHPSLMVKKLRGTDKYEIRVSRGYRLTFRYIDEILELRRVGTHDILKREGTKA